MITITIPAWLVWFSIGAWAATAILNGLNSFMRRRSQRIWDEIFAEQDRLDAQIKSLVAQDLGVTRKGGDA